jgi:hypothetical protein
MDTRLHVQDVDAMRYSKQQSPASELPHTVPPLNPELIDKKAKFCGCQKASNESEWIRVPCIAY